MKFLYPTGSRPLEGYTIKRGVGRGGFGEVYFATSDAGKEVAVKLIRRNLDVELRGVTHCLNLKHPNLIGLFDIREDESGDQWVIMEYVSGDSLEQLIEQHPDGMPEADVVRWFREMCAGVAYLHDHGIVHRDLKPANVFLDGYSGSQGIVKIGDYGLAKFISCSRRSGQTESVGTVHYMAPEIANGRYGREVDTYALGVILYEMLTGHVPFEGESMGEVIMKHLTAEPDLSAVPSAFRTAVERTLAKDPELRVGSVNELVALLPGGVTESSSATVVPAPDGLGDSRNFSNTHVRGVRPQNRDHRPHRDIIPEPLALAVSENWQRMLERWYRWDINPAFKGILLFIMVGLGLLTWWIWLFGGVALGAVYLVYYIFWSTMMEPGMRAHRDRRAAAVAAKQADPPVELKQKDLIDDAPRPKPRRRTPFRRPLKPQDWMPAAYRQLREMPFRDKAGGYIVSLLGSAIVCALLSLGALIFNPDMRAVDLQAFWLWMSVTTTLGSWAVISITRFSEGRFEDQVPMRTLMAGGGLLLGTVAFGLGHALMIGVPDIQDFGVDPNDTMFHELLDVPRTSHTAWHAPNMAHVEFVSSVVYFAMLFGLLRWWRLSEITREKRLSLWGTAIVVAAAFFLHLVCWYPQPGGIAVAATIAVATQLTSPWLRPSQRRALADATV